MLVQANQTWESRQMTKPKPRIRVVDADPGQFANNLDQLIRLVGHSRKEAAEAIGVTQSAIYRALVNGTLEKCGIHNRNRKPVTIRGVHYESQTAAAKALGLRHSPNAALKTRWQAEAGAKLARLGLTQPS